MKLLIEDYTYYETADLIDLIKNSDVLKTPTKKLLIKYVDDVSVQLTELYHQLSRKPVGLHCYKDLELINNQFAELILFILQTDNVHKSELTTRTNRINGLINKLVNSLEYSVTINIFEQIQNCYYDIKELNDTFLSKCTPIIVNTRTDKEDKSYYGFSTNSKISNINSKNINKLSDIVDNDKYANTDNNIKNYTKNSLNTIINKPTGYIVKPSSLQHKRSTLDFNKRKLTINNNERDLYNGK